MTLELLNDEGDVIATTETDRSGRYRFDDFRETGDYQVRVANSSLQLTSDDTLDALISRGNERVRGLNFGVGLLDQLAEDTAKARSRNRQNGPASIVDMLLSSDDPLA